VFTASTLKKKVKDELFVMSHNKVPKKQSTSFKEEAHSEHMIQESFKHYMKK
jgi:hypothetical protein